MSGDVMAFLHFVESQHALDEVALEARLLDEHFDERGDPRADGMRVDLRGVAPDHAGDVELPQPLVHRRGGEADPLRDLGLLELGVALDQSQNGPVLRVDCLMHIRLSDHGS